MSEFSILNSDPRGHIDRAGLLMEQRRFELAEGELRQEISTNPDDPLAHALLALCLSEQKKHREALAAARRGVHLGPDFAYAHYVLASIYNEQDRLAESEASAREAIRLDPEEADYYALLSGLGVQRRRWREALEAAESGLRIDSEHVGCINLRALALNKMGRSDEAAVAIEGALGVDPENALTHTSRGWQEVERGNYDEAMGHFREALRRDAELEWAREGVAEVLKARNPVYRVMLRYFLWSSRLSGRGMWGFIIGAYFLSRLLRGTIRASPELAPFLWPIYGLYIAFVLLTWVAKPLFNLMLRLDPVGRVALSRDQFRASNWVGGVILLAILSVAAWLLTGVNALLVLAAVSGAMALPISATFENDSPRGRRVLRNYTIVLGALGLFGAGFALLDKELSLAPAGLFFLAFFAFQWVANAYSIRS